MITSHKTPSPHVVTILMIVTSVILGALFILRQSFNLFVVKRLKGTTFPRTFPLGPIWHIYLQDLAACITCLLTCIIFLVWRYARHHRHKAVMISTLVVLVLIIIINAMLFLAVLDNDIRPPLVDRQKDLADTGDSFGLYFKLTLDTYKAEWNAKVKEMNPPLSQEMRDRMVANQVEEYRVYVKAWSIVLRLCSLLSLCIGWICIAICSLVIASIRHS